MSQEAADLSAPEPTLRGPLIPRVDVLLRRLEPDPVDTTTHSNGKKKKKKKQQPKQCTCTNTTLFNAGCQCEAKRPSGTWTFTSLGVSAHNANERTNVVTRLLEPALFLYLPRSFCHPALPEEGDGSWKFDLMNSLEVLDAIRKGSDTLHLIYAQVGFMYKVHKTDFVPLLS